MNIFSNKIFIRHFRPWQHIIKRWLARDQPELFDCRPDLRDRGICTVDLCDGSKCLTEPRVIIVGAGMAGLSAAARLSQRGINNFTVLEAYERPGGRIRSCWLGDIVAELGASWEPDTTTDHPIYTMSLTESSPSVPGTGHCRALFNTIASEKMEFTPMISAYHKFKKIEKEVALIFSLGDTKQHGSLNSFMSLRIQQELHEYKEEHQHDAARIMFGLMHMLRARCGNDTAMLCTDHQGCFMNIPGGKVRIPLGRVGVLAPILRQIPEGAIRYCKPVNCIYWGANQTSGYRATVCTSDGEEFPADYVIVTVSIGVLKCNNLFCPELPASKMDSIRTLQFGFCNKIYLEYGRPFWFWHNGPINFKFDFKTMSDRRGWTRGLTSLQIVPNSDHVLSGSVVGEEAMILESLCDRDIAEGITEILKLSTEKKDIPYPTTILRSCWISDPFFCGAYSQECECSDGSAQRALACPLPGLYESIPPILLFAGEATVPGHYATVAGARISGIREAERIVQLTKIYKGPPALDARKGICKQRESSTCKN